ncbi:hypothetical protein K445DRAFT_364069 [Daldinia sp. EC12]|nr:hypothetical protein K445DRAFT_364069 [Daldinia sp. EC12]
MSDYHYSPLAPGQFRVIHLNPGTSSKVTASLEVVNRLDRCYYEAVSYCWGSDELTQVVTMNDESVLKVTDSVYSLLFHLRHRENTRKLWVDQMCINQTDHAEKAAQVKDIRKVYKYTNRLIIWLGDGDDESDQAMDILHNVSNRLGIKGFADITSELNLAGLSLTVDSSGSISAWPWIKVARLVSRPWFTRMWVVPEVFLAADNESIVCCGFSQISWWKFSILHKGLTNSPWSPEDSTTFSTEMNYETATTLPLEWLLDSFGSMEEHLKLFYILWYMKERHCKQPRDRIFAIRPLIPSLGAGDLVPNFDDACSDVQVFTEATRLIISSSKSLTVLGVCQLRRNLSGLPSWVPDWTCNGLTRPTKSISNIPYCWETEWYAAIPVSEPRIDDSPLDELHIHGYCIDRVSQVVSDFDSSPDYLVINIEKIVSKFLYLVTTMYNDGEIRNEAEAVELMVAKTLALDQGENGIPPAKDIPNDRPLSSMIKRRIYSTLRFRRPFVTVKKDLGVGPYEVLPGDIICLFPGGTVPFVLRKIDQHYILVGECYCHNIMQGSAVKHLGKEYKLELFRIK